MMIPLSRSGHSLRARLAERRFQDGDNATAILSLRSGYRLDRALTRRLYHRYSAGQTMRKVIRETIVELLALGLTDTAIVGVFAHTVEQIARSHGLEKRSLLTGQPDWQTAQAEIVELASFELDLALGVSG